MPDRASTADRAADDSGDGGAKSKVIRRTLGQLRQGFPYTAAVSASETVGGAS
jgi:hypothetical protein